MPHEAVPLSRNVEDMLELDRTQQTAAVLEHLQSLPWARIDCSWRDAKLSMFAHNHIQVTRGWLNFEVRATAAVMSQLLRPCHVESSPS
jgi:hypothetical protein